jgi:WD40 repeat protein/serine/threonine protein kinase
MSTGDSSRDRDPLDQMAEEFVARHRRGEHPPLSEFIGRHPELADQIRDLFPALVVMERLKPADHDATGNFVAEPPGQGPGTCERLGEYRILREVGRGGMGVVYEAIQESLGRHVALKVLPLNGRIDSVQMERFQLEARSAARLHHTHIVPVYGVGEHHGVHFYAMQFIHGCGLDSVINDLRRLRRGAPADEPEPAGLATVANATSSRAAAGLLLTGQVSRPRPAGADEGRPSPRPVESSALSGRSDPGYFRSVARIGMQVAEALAHAHGQGILHRDIKPSNLMLDAEGEIWITDFGLAKVEGSDGLTRTGDIVGTLRYMAPERFEGWSDPRSDVYGLGMTLYELLTLRPAHEAATRARLIEKVLHEPAPPPRKIDLTIPRDLETIVLKAIAKEPAERYSTARTLADDLQNFLVGKPIQARRVGPLERAWRWCRRNPAAAGLIGASGLAAMALVGLVVGYAFIGQLRIKNTQIGAANEQLKMANQQVQEALRNEQAFLYTNRVIRARHELNDHNPYRAEQLLEECPSDGRGWEWNYLKRQCRTELLTLVGHQAIINSVAVSRDGRRIASASYDRTVRIWDGTTGNLLHIWDEYLHPVWGVAISPDGRSIATASGTLGEPDPVLIRDLEDGHILSTEARTGKDSGLAFSTDGRFLAVAGGELAGAHSYVQVLDASTGKVLRTIPTPGQPTYFPSFSPDSRRVLATVGGSNSEDPVNAINRVAVWDVETGIERLSPSGHRASVVSAGFSPDGKTITSCGHDAAVRIFDADTGHLRQELPGHAGCVNQVAFSADSRRIASASDDNTIIIWDADGGRPIRTLCGHRSGIFGLAFYRDGERLVTSGYDGELKIWDTTTPKDGEVVPTPAGSGRVFELAFNHRGDRLASACNDHTVRLWEMPQGQLYRTLTGHNAVVLGVAFSRDDRWIASAAGDWRSPDQEGEVRLWDAHTGRPQWARKAHRGIAWTVAFSPDGSRLASGGGEVFAHDDQIAIWDVASGDLLNRIPCPEGGIHCVAFSPNGHQLVAATGNLARAWDVETGQALVTFSGHRNNVLHAIYSADGSRLATTSADLSIRIWNAATGEEVRRLLGHSLAVDGLAFSPDGRRLASGGGDKLLKTWDPANGQELLSLRGHDNYIWSVAFSPDGNSIATSDQLGTIKLWNGTPPEITLNRTAARPPH